MSKYIATVKTTQQWFKTIEVKKGDEPEEEAEDNFVKTHYENFDDSWKNALIFEEEHEVIEVEKVNKEKK